MNENKRLAELLGIEPRCYTQSTLTGHCQVHTLYPLSYLEANNLEPYGDIKYIDFQEPDNFVKLLECLTKTFTNFTINTDSEGNITTSWFHFGTQFEEEFLNISKDLTEAIIKTSIESMYFAYLADELKQQAQKVNWKY